MTDTAKNSAAAEEGVYETPEDIAAEAAKPAERAARTDADSPIAPVDPFEPGSLGWLLPWAETGEGDVLTPDEALEVFLEWVDARGMELWPHQEDALMDLAVGDSVILGTPTGSGKSMVALGLCFMAVATGRVAYYTAPIKALVSEKFFDMVDILGRENVGMITGDTTINTEAPVICCTAEILANQALREGPASKVACVVMDEFHFYADPDRGWAWQVPLLTLPNAQFLLMSATLGDVTDIAERARGAHRAPRRPGDRRAAPRAVVLRLHLRDFGSHRRVGPARRRGADVHRALLPGRGAEERTGAGQLRRVGQGPARGDQTGHEGHEVHDPLRQDSATAAAPPAWACTMRGCCRATGCLVERLAQQGLLAGHLRHRHARCRHQRAHPHRGAHAAHQVRRHQDAPLAFARVPPDRGPGGAAHGFDTEGHGGGARPPSTRSRTTRQSLKAGDDPKKLSAA